MRITEPIFIRRTAARAYEATGRVEGCPKIQTRGRSEEEAKDRFFRACDRIGSGRRRNYGSRQVHA